MPKYSLLFRVDPLPTWEGYKTWDWKKLTFNTKVKKENAEYEFRRKLYHDLGLKLESRAWADINLDSDNLITILNVIKELKHKGVACLGSGILREEMTEDELNNCEWFLINPPKLSVGYDFSLWDPYPTCRADKFSPLLHIQEYHCVSEQFKKIVEQKKLTGLEFLWVEDKGKYKARQWYSAIAQEPLGHGIDDVWFDRQKYEEISGKIDPIHNYGMRSFDNEYFKEGWTTGSPQKDELLKMFPKECFGLNFYTQPRFLRKHLPDTDFAYIWDHVDGPNREGKIMRFRDLCFNKRTKDILIEKKMISMENVSGILLYNRLPKGINDLDKNVGFPPPVYTSKEFLLLKKEEALLYKLFKKKERTSRKANMSQSIKMLRKFKKLNPETFYKGATKNNLDKLKKDLPQILPVNWEKVLKITNGGAFHYGDYESCYIVPTNELFKFHGDLVKNGKENYDDYPEGYLNMCYNDTGDYFALNINKISNNKQDCPVVLFSHETQCVGREWPNIADFLETILTEDWPEE